MEEKGFDDVIINIEDELDWYRISFTFMVYPGETFEDAHEKVFHSLGHFPYLIHSSYPIEKERTGTWGQYIKQTVDIGVFKDVTLEDLYSKFHNVTHLQQHELAEEQPVIEKVKAASK